jgi:hypothetical protein
LVSLPADRITFPVTQCAEYSDRRQPSLRAMEEIAWVTKAPHGLAVMKLSTRFPELSMNRATTSPSAER